MNQCVLRTFGKKMGIGTLWVVGCILVVMGLIAVLAVVVMALGEEGNALMDELCGLTCLSSLVVIIPLAIGGATLEALKNSYMECGR